MRIQANKNKLIQELKNLPSIKTLKKDKNQEQTVK